MDTDRSPLKDNVERIKLILVSEATGKYYNNHVERKRKDEEYRNLRNIIITDAALKKMVPSFLSTCRSLDEFYTFIKGKFSTYEQRREFLRDEFDKALTYLENEQSRPIDEGIRATLSILDVGRVNDEWQKAVERLKDDPDGAITASRTMLETICKCILDERHISYKSDATLSGLYFQVSSVLNLGPNRETDEIVRKILGACNTIVDNVGKMRNIMGDAHGGGINDSRPEHKYAELCVNMAGSMGSFIVVSWQEQQKKSLNNNL